MALLYGSLVTSIMSLLTLNIGYYMFTPEVDVQVYQTMEFSGMFNHKHVIDTWSLLEVSTAILFSLNYGGGVLGFLVVFTGLWEVAQFNFYEKGLKWSSTYFNVSPSTYTYSKNLNIKLVNLVLGSGIGLVLHYILLQYLIYATTLLLCVATYAIVGSKFVKQKGEFQCAVALSIAFLYFATDLTTAFLSLMVSFAFTDLKTLVMKSLDGVSLPSQGKASTCSQEASVPLPVSPPLGIPGSRLRIAP